MQTLDIKLEDVGSDKCAYRFLVEQYLRQKKEVPREYMGCELCPGLPELIQDGCIDYTTIDHVIGFYRVMQQ